MTAFTIFALVLTFAYVVYFAVMITLDLHGKKDNQKSEEEDFDVSGMTDNVEEPVAISENLDNAEDTGMTYTEQTDEEGLRVIAPSGNYATESDAQESHVQEETPQSPQTTSEMLNEENEAYMEDTDPEYQLSMESDEYFQHLNDRHNQRKIEKKNVIDHL